MELPDLNETERLALVGLIRTIVLADRVGSEEEADIIEDIAMGIGEDEYQKASDVVETKYADAASLKALLARVERQEARELIFGTALDLAVTDTIGIEHESDLLSWLSATWHIETELQEPLPA